jgi:hypothetical protein
VESDDRHSARPEQEGPSFDEGMDTEPRTDEDVEPNFARGQSAEPPEGDRHPRFSEGQEELPETPEKEHEGRFSEGQEELPENA